MSSSYPHRNTSHSTRPSRSNTATNPSGDSLNTFATTVSARERQRARLYGTATTDETTGQEKITPPSYRSRRETVGGVDAPMPRKGTLSKPQSLTRRPAVKDSTTGSRARGSSKPPSSYKAPPQLKASTEQDLQAASSANRQRAESERAKALKVVQTPSALREVVRDVESGRFTGGPRGRAGSMAAGPSAEDAGREVPRRESSVRGLSRSSAVKKGESPRRPSMAGPLPRLPFQ